MKSIDIKKDIHLLIDKIENENLLEHFMPYCFKALKKRKMFYGINYQKSSRNKYYFHLMKALMSQI